MQDIVDEYARARAGRAGWSRRHHLAARGGQGGITAAVVLGGGRGPVTIGLSEAADPAEIAAAADEARELALLALRLGRAPGAYRLSDLLLEYQITRPGRARDLLAATVQPLAAHPHLQQALSAYLQHEHGRQLAAKSLHVHPNTLDYRLRRVAELTGLIRRNRPRRGRRRGALGGQGTLRIRASR